MITHFVTVNLSKCRLLRTISIFLVFAEIPGNVNATTLPIHTSSRIP